MVTRAAELVGTSCRDLGCFRKVRESLRLFIVCFLLLCSASSNGVQGEPQGEQANDS
jgi:hypothetical protein